MIPWTTQPAKLLCPWSFPGKNTGEGCHFLLQGIFPTQGLNEPASPALAEGFFTTEPPEKPKSTCTLYKNIQFSSLAQSCPNLATPWIAACQASLSISWSSLKLTSIELVMPSSHLILCHPLLFLPPISPSIRVFSNESTLRMRWAKYWSFSFSISPSNEHSGVISFRMDWLDLLAVQGTLKSLLQHHSSKASIL